MPATDFYPSEITLPMWAPAFAKVLALIALDSHATFAVAVSFIGNEGYTMRFTDLEASALSAEVRAVLRGGPDGYEVNGRRVELPRVEEGDAAWSAFATALERGRHRLRAYLHEQGIKRRGMSGFNGPEWVEQGDAT
jgi:hypothetical protein